MMIILMLCQWLVGLAFQLGMYALTAYVAAYYARKGWDRGYTLLIRAAAFEEMGLAERALDLYHDAALDEKRRREAGEQPDDRHLTYL